MGIPDGHCSSVSERSDPRAAAPTGSGVAGDGVFPPAGRGGRAGGCRRVNTNMPCVRQEDPAQAERPQLQAGNGSSSQRVSPGVRKAALASRLCPLSAPGHPHSRRTAFILNLEVGVL